MKTILQVNTSILSNEGQSTRLANEFVAALDLFETLRERFVRRREFGAGALLQIGLDRRVERVAIERPPVIRVEARIDGELGGAEGAAEAAEHVGTGLCRRSDPGEAKGVAARDRNPRRLRHGGCKITGDTLREAAGSENEDVELVTQPAQPIAGGKTLMYFRVKPNNGIEPYLGAMAHMLAASSDLVDMIHSHPIQATDHGAEYKQLQFNMTFPSAGIYRVWVQSQRKGVVNTVAFNIPVRQN